MQDNFKIYYRISDKGNPLGRTELKGTGLEIITRRKCFDNLVSVFGLDNLHVTADNANLETIQFLKEKGVKEIEITNLGNTMSFWHIVNLAIENSLSDSDICYFPEDDYLHMPDSEKYIREGLEISDYLSLYDSLDKYIDTNKGGNNYLISGGGEDTKVMITKSIHWKKTNATTNSFATRVKTLKEDYDIIKYFCPEGSAHPMDYLMFRFLIEQRNRILINCIPGKSAHVGLEMPPFVDWLSLVK
jgi:hypothetical protein